MYQTAVATSNELWEAGFARFPKFLAEQQRAGILLHRQLARGEPVNVMRWAQALGTSTAEAEVLLLTSPLSPFVQMGGDGRVAGFWGLSTVPTHHRFTLDDRTLWAWCAMDSLVLPELIGETAQVESRDPESGELVHLTVSPTGIESCEPNRVWVSVNLPGAWELSSAEQVIATAGHLVFFFTSQASGERWVAKHARTVLLPLTEAFAWAKSLNVWVFGRELARLGAFSKATASATRAGS